MSSWALLPIEPKLDGENFDHWILWTSVPFGVISLLAFTTPDFSENGKVIYALTTYFFIGHHLLCE